MLNHGTVESIEHTLRCLRGDIELREQDITYETAAVADWEDSDEGRAFVAELNRIRAVADYLEGLLPVPA